MLVLDSLIRATSSLERACSYVTARESKEVISSEEFEILRAAVIQNFEFTYELCWKYTKRWLEENYNPTSVQGISRKQLFRLAIENGLIDDFDAWVRYHELRNLTSHTYDIKVAQQIYDEAPSFLLAAQRLLKAIEVRND